MTEVFRLCDDYLTRWAALDPVAAGMVGLSGVFGAATDYGPDGYAAREELIATTLAAAIVADPSREGLAALLSLERDALFFLFRIMWGIVGPLALSWFIWKTADMRSNQAATGLLYVALVFVLIGELLSSYLTVATGFPA